MKLIKLSFYLLTLSLIISCEPESTERQLVFTGTVKDGDTGVPLAGVKVKLDVYAKESQFESFTAFQDSTFTNNSGIYSFNIKYDESLFNLTNYLVTPTKSYYGFSSSSSALLISPSTGLRLHDNVDIENPNVNEFVMRETAEVKLVGNKLDVAAADTLFYMQVLKGVSGYESVYFGDGEGQFTNVQNEKLYRYFARHVDKTRFDFRIKKADGTITTSNKEVVLERSKTLTVSMDF